MPISDNPEKGPWLRLLLIRCLRPDRTKLMVKQFIRDSPYMGSRFVEPVTDTMETIFEDTTAGVPVIFLLSVGADPTDSVESLAKKFRQQLVSVSSNRLTNKNTIVF